jgi:uncharacterized membrane protein
MIELIFGTVSIVLMVLVVVLGYLTDRASEKQALSERIDRMTEAKNVAQHPLWADTQPMRREDFL